MQCLFCWLRIVKHWIYLCSGWTFKYMENRKEYLWEICECPYPIRFLRTTRIFTLVEMHGNVTTSPSAYLCIFVPHELVLYWLSVLCVCVCVCTLLEVPHPHVFHIPQCLLQFHPSDQLLLLQSSLFHSFFAFPSPFTFIPYECIRISHAPHAFRHCLTWLLLIPSSIWKPLSFCSLRARNEHTADPSLFWLRIGWREGDPVLRKYSGVEHPYGKSQKALVGLELSKIGSVCIT